MRSYKLIINFITHSYLLCMLYQHLGHGYICLFPVLHVDTQTACSLDHCTSHYPEKQGQFPVQRLNWVAQLLLQNDSASPLSMKIDFIELHAYITTFATYSFDALNRGLDPLDWSTCLLCSWRDILGHFQYTHTTLKGDYLDKVDMVTWYKKKGTKRLNLQWWIPLLIWFLIPFHCSSSPLQCSSPVNPVHWIRIYIRILPSIT